MANSTRIGKVHHQGRIFYRQKLTESFAYAILVLDYA